MLGQEFDSIAYDNCRGLPYAFNVQFQKYPYSPDRRPKNLKKCMKLNWNFQRGVGILEKIPSVGEV